MVVEYDTIVVGSGQGGSPLAMRLAKNGQKTALIEKEHLGGTCVNVGCTPTKTLVASARAAHVGNNSERLGVEGSASVDFEAVMERKDRIVSSFRGGKQEQVDTIDALDLYRESAEFVDERILETGDTRLTADRIVLNVGLRPLVPPIDGVEDVDFLTSTDLLRLDEQPDELIVIGGGYVGCEFAQMFSRFGSDVTVLQGGSALLDREDEEVTRQVETVFEREGITVETDFRVTSMREDGDKKIVASDGDEHRGDEVLLAVGRRPNTDRLNLEATGLSTDDRGFLPVDDDLKTPVEGIWAIGDVTGNAPFTNVSYHDHQILYENWVKGGSDRQRPGDRNVTHAVFVDPPIGGVGLNEREARENDVEYVAASTPMSQVARGIEAGETDGILKLLADPSSREILGATVMGINADDIVHVFTALMDAGATVDVLEDMVCAHPAVSEALPVLARKLDL